MPNYFEIHAQIYKLTGRWMHKERMHNAHTYTEMKL